MTVETFFDLFLKELASAPQMQTYYKFLNDEKSFEFRKAYFIQRLKYVENQIKEKDSLVFDCGCGYGTTCLFLAMNGISSYGTTLEFYFDQLNKRKDYWKQYGNVDLFQVDYANLFDNEIKNYHFDYIILQDALHHLEPLGDAIAIFKYILNKGGKLIAIEENGNNIIKQLQLFKQRGNKKIIPLWDERLQKEILLGNENIRSYSRWEKAFNKFGLKIDTSSVEYIRFYYPSSYKNHSIEGIIEKEQTLAKKNSFIRKYFFFGLNFTVNHVEAIHNG